MEEADFTEREVERSQERSTHWWLGSPPQNGLDHVRWLNFDDSLRYRTVYIIFVCTFIYVYMCDMYLWRRFAITCFYSVCSLLGQKACHDTWTYHCSIDVRVPCFETWGTCNAWRFGFSVVVIPMADLSWVMGLLLLDRCVRPRNVQKVLGKINATLQHRKEDHPLHGCFIPMLYFPSKPLASHIVIYWIVSSSPPFAGSYRILRCH